MEEASVDLSDLKKIYRSLKISYLITSKAVTENWNAVYSYFPSYDYLMEKSRDRPIFRLRALKFYTYIEKLFFYILSKINYDLSPYTFSSLLRKSANTNFFPTHL